MAEQELREKVKGILKIPRSFVGTMPYDDWVANQIDEAYKEAGYIKLEKGQAIIDISKLKDGLDSQVE